MVTTDYDKTPSSLSTVVTVSVSIYPASTDTFILRPLGWNYISRLNRGRLYLYHISLLLCQCDGVHHQGEDTEEGEQLQSQPRRLHSAQGLGEETFPEHTFT